MTVLELTRKQTAAFWVMVVALFVAPYTCGRAGRVPPPCSESVAPMEEHQSVYCYGPAHVAVAHVNGHDVIVCRCPR